MRAEDEVCSRGDLMGPASMNDRGYWMYETSSVLRPAIEAYLGGGPLTLHHIATLRAYLRQWVRATIWDRNPHAGPTEKAWLAGMRDDVDELTSREAIERWLDTALDHGIDPL
jgi:hypothetical protein